MVWECNTTVGFKSTDAIKFYFTCQRRPAAGSGDAFLRVSHSTHIQSSTTDTGLLFNRRREIST